MCSHEELPQVLTRPATELPDLDQGGVRTFGPQACPGGQEGHTRPEGDGTPEVDGQTRRPQVEQGVVRAFRPDRQGIVGAPVHERLAGPRHDPAWALGTLQDGGRVGTGGGAHAAQRCRAANGCSHRQEQRADLWKAGVTLPNGPPDHWCSDFPAVPLAPWGDLPDETVRGVDPLRQSLNQARGTAGISCAWAVPSPVAFVIVGLLSQSAPPSTELSGRHERSRVLPIVRLKFLVKLRVLSP